MNNCPLTLDTIDFNSLPLNPSFQSFHPSLTPSSIQQHPPIFSFENYQNYLTQYEHLPPPPPQPRLPDFQVVGKKAKSKKRRPKPIVDPNAPPKPKRKTGLNKPLILSTVLSELMEAKELSRPELVQKLWKYIKENDLQDPADRRFILCDAKLKKIFLQDRVNSFGMNKDLSAHLTKKDPPLEEQS
ncbi:SWIB/MDM2 domain-containing protein [Sporodiniella umbellata]|nr:SWIB/MDM2 domain-containing protein [Sporodiniella umbellata]